MTDVLVITMKAVSVSTGNDETLAEWCMNRCSEVWNMCYRFPKTMRALCYIAIADHPDFEAGLCSVVNFVVVLVGIQTLAELTVVDCERRVSCARGPFSCMGVVIWGIGSQHHLFARHFLFFDWGIEVFFLLCLSVPCNCPSCLDCVFWRVLLLSLDVYSPKALETTPGTAQALVIPRL